MLKFLNRSFVISLILILISALCACSGLSEPSVSYETAASGESSAPAEQPRKADSSENGQTIVALAPSLNETLIDLELGDKIIGYDFESEGIEGLSPDAVKFDIAAPDLEKLIELSPDLVFVSGISFYDAENPYQPLEDAGITVVSIPTAGSVEEIYSGIAQTAAAAGVPEKGEQLNEQLASSLNKIKERAEEIPESERKSVYFEISAAPDMYSTGSGTYLNELIELIGAENILAGSEGWMPVNGEAVAAADPDVILTNVNYIEDPVSEIISRDGFAGITAVKNGDVHYIDNRASSLPNENVAKAALEMAKAVYPDYFDEF